MKKNSLQKILKLRGLTCQDLAHAIGENYGSVQRIMSGDRKSPVRIRRKIASFLNLDADRVWDGVDVEKYLARQIQKNIDQAAAIELKKIRRRYQQRYLGSSGGDAEKAA